MADSTDTGVQRRAVLKAAGGLSVLGGVPAVGTVTAGATQDDRVVWTYETRSRVWSSPTVVGGTVYVGSDDGNLYALDAADGTEAWRYRTERSATAWVRSSPNVVDGVAYVGSGDGRLHAVDAAEGTEEWTFQTDDDVRSSPTVTDGTAYVGSFDNHLYAVDATNGTEDWSLEFGDEGTVASSPTVVDDTVFVLEYPDGQEGRNVSAFDAAEGTRQWTFGREDEGFVPSPTVADGVVYSGTGRLSGFDAGVYAIDADTGSELWRFDDDDFSGVLGGLTVAGGTVYTGADFRGEGAIAAIDAATGNLSWRFESNVVVASSPTVATGTVYFGTNDNYLYAVDAAEGTLEWRFETDDEVVSSPTVVDGVVYVASKDNRVYALDAGTGGSSEDSRVRLGTLGHHHRWAGQQSQSIAVDATETDAGTRDGTQAGADATTQPRAGRTPTRTAAAAKGTDPPAGQEATSADGPGFTTVAALLGGASGLAARWLSGSDADGRS